MAVVFVVFEKKLVIFRKYSFDLFYFELKKELLFREVSFLEVVGVRSVLFGKGILLGKGVL